MEPNTTSLQLHLFCLWIIAFILRLSVLRFADSADGVRCIASERTALLKFKQSLQDPLHLLSSWTSDAETDCCGWDGVSCDPQTGHVLMLHLQGDYYSRRLSGEISSSLLELSYLTHLDLSSNSFQKVPDFFGSFSRLTYLDLSFNNISGTFPCQLGNLSMLQFLDLGENRDITVDNTEWMDDLSSLRVLSLSNVYFRNKSWLKSIKMHPSLSTVELDACQFDGIDPASLSRVDSSKTLSRLVLWDNSFNALIESWLLNVSAALVDFVIVSQQLKGPIPYFLGGMISLQHLDLSSNELEGNIPTSFQNLCSLKTLKLSYNYMNGLFSDTVGNLKCAKNTLEILHIKGNNLKGSIHGITEFKSLRELDLSENNLSGSLPEFSKLPNLEKLDVSENNLSGSLPEFSKLPNLEVLDASQNKLNGVVSEVHLSNLSRLQMLDLSDNSLILDFDDEWTPSFQLDLIILRSCKIGPQFPLWLRSQKNFSDLDISNSEISDVVPTWLWSLPFKLEYLNLSFNHLSGMVPNLSLQFHSFPTVDLSSNLFYGIIPGFFYGAGLLNLCNNAFTGSLDFLCAGMDSKMDYLDLSYNRLSGELPNCLAGLKNLLFLNLENNSFSGSIPNSIGFLKRAESIRLGKNKLTGGLPSSMRNCYFLELLDVGENKLTGEVPYWFRNNLNYLIARSNEFTGLVSSALCHLQSLRILDLSFNNLSGAIPSCLSNLTAFVNDESTMSSISHIIYADYIRSLYYDLTSVVWKGSEREYGKTLGLLKMIDLSSNNLVGQIPEELTSLVEMVALNLSRNHLVGKIPSRIGHLKRLDWLDLSGNELSGEIPTSLADISLLGKLDLSNNKLTGRIPSSTQLQSFDASSYLGNPGLCGPPLSECPGDGKTGFGGTENGNEQSQEWVDMQSFYTGTGVGFAVGFLGILRSLLSSNRWSRFVIRKVDHLYLKVSLLLAH